MNGKENIEVYPPPERKLRPLLPLRKKKTSALQECAVNVSRFADPVSQEEIEIAAQGVVPDNTKCNNEWAANNFAEWAKARTQKSPEEPVPDNLLSCLDEKLLCKWLFRYVMETRQASGKPYPPKSIYALLCGLFTDCLRQDEQKDVMASNGRLVQVM